ncbi:hypothetical protein NG791_27260 [Laspinema sp. D1]|uniref:hypothetical protein n=1 Tax=Laspinema palackyanum TaxID=3231601 RepID=UPI003488AF3F|nr:hypothetical protein [Laspinema sp. D2b]
MEQIANILPQVIPHIITAQNGLYPVVQNAIASSQIRIDTLPYAIRWHIPANKYFQAKGFIEELTRPAGGYNATFSDGNWLNPVNKTWVPEPIVLVKSFMAADVLQRHLPTILQNSYRMGKALGEQAIAVEILTNNVMIIIDSMT